jgi:CRP-like cAMP-binding protein
LILYAESLKTLKKMLKRQLINKLGALHPVSKGYQQFIETDNPFIYRTVKKGALILLPGKDAHDLHFIGRGLFKLYRYDARAEQLVTGFFCEDSFMMLPNDFYDGSKNETNYLCALEDSELLTICRRDMEPIYSRFPESRIHNDRIRSQISQGMVEHVILLLAPKDDRYGLYADLHPNIVFRLAGHLLSNHLGICSKTLNRGKRLFLLGNKSRKENFVR